MHENDPIVVTGIGKVTHLGCDVEQFWDVMFEEETDKLVLSKLQELRRQKTFMVGDNWNPKELLGQRGLRFMVPATKYLMGATKLALKHAQLLDSMPAPKELGIVVGCNFTGMESAIDYDQTTISDGPKFVSPMQAPNALGNSPASQMGIKFNAQASNTTLATGKCAGLDALGYGINLIQKKRANYVIVGGVEHLNENIVWLYEQSKLLPSVYSDKQGIPFSSESAGLIASEGAGVVVLERRSSALARGAAIWGEVANWESGFSLNRKSGHRTKTLKRTLTRLLTSATLSPNEVDLIISGANGYVEMDEIERDVLGEMFDSEKTSIYPVKRIIGESFGASGLLQLIAGLGVLAKQKLPADTNLREVHLQPVSTTAGGSLERSFQNNPDRILLTSQNYSGEMSAVLVRNV
ncbi:beta-ketoacyl synthase N-terminal-like domain-containing protein [Metabacillus arenae]|uniref:Ketosynthase family 3 (KS3) domain-containing protein n=1 Tax=Metabacillus arenae TaxID=2771434 RepID=A0A926NE62_9BACI|nr:beta-ketoacyl synthase N-terminal-like domain-containing protein [Metabacillus arenae]MBD1379495.1 hypothetical protein [Metabacillus arenae]